LPGFSEDDEGVLWYMGRICVPNVKELKYRILREAHESAYSSHPRGNKMYHDLKATYCWYGIKETLLSMLPFATLLSESKPNINDLLDYCSVAIAQVEVGRDCHGFYRGFAKNSVGL
jgi:hypothetical protein